MTDEFIDTLTQFAHMLMHFHNGNRDEKNLENHASHLHLALRRKDYDEAISAMKAWIESVTNGE